jgi:hypothetical protein
MKQLTWWFRFMGVFYTLLGVINLYSVLVDPAYFESVVPSAWGSAAVQAFVDGWSPFAFEVIGIGTFCLWASRRPEKYVSTVWLLVWLELLHGVFDDTYLISRGYGVASYVAFIVVHFIIIGTGIRAVRSVAVRDSSAARLISAG